MDDESKQIMKDAFRRLPKKVQEAITSAELPHKFDYIVKKHSLHLDQAGALEAETGLVMLGLVRPQEYTDNIKRELRLSEEETTNVVNDVDELILSDIKDGLRELYGETEEEEETELVRASVPTEGGASESTLKNPHEHTVSAKKEEIMREIEKTIEIPQVHLPKSRLTNINERLRNRDMEVRTEAKHMEDLRLKEAEARRAEAKAVSAAAAAPAAAATTSMGENFVQKKLTETVKAPRQEVEVAAPKPEEKAKVDPYREPAN